MNEESLIWEDNGETWTFAELLEKIREHFGEDSKLEDFSIKTHSTLQGCDCGSCDRYCDRQIEIKRIVK